MEEILTKMYKYCAYQDRCTSEVLRKLKDLGATETAIPKIIAHLQAERMLDEERFARSFARGKFVYKKWGRQKIKHELRKKKVPENLIELGIAKEISDEDYQQTIEYWVGRKSAQWETLSFIERKQKIMRFLQQKGFEWHQVQQAIDAKA